MNNKIVTIILILGISALTSCRSARYDIVNKPGQSDDGNPNGFGDPQAKTSFYYEATPGTAHPNEEVKFTAFCDSKESYKVEWNFGDDSAKVEGKTVVHKFGKPGTFKVVGTCVLADGRRIDSSSNIKIYDPNDPNNPNQTPSQRSPSQSAPDQNDPGQSNPDQNDPGQSNPGQN